MARVMVNHIPYPAKLKPVNSIEDCWNSVMIRRALDVPVLGMDRALLRDLTETD